MTRQTFYSALACASDKRQQGYTSVEYVVVTFVVIGMLFLPFPGSQGLSAVGMVLAGLKNFQMHTTYLLSLP